MTTLRRIVAVTLLLSYLCDVAVVIGGAAYTPNNFYPALSGSSLFHPRGRSPSREPSPPPRPFAVQPRTQTSRGGGGGGGDEVDPSDFPLLSPKDKRLMGIFRCYGWGPGCSDSSFFAPRHKAPSSSSSSSSSQMTRSRHDEISNPSSYASPSSSPSSSVQQRTSNANTKFEPFFTLTSGGSWGPTGRKRSGMRRFSVAEKRLNFLKQILRDMLEDADEDDTSGRSRSLGLRKRSDRSVPNSRTRLFLAEVARLQRQFDRSRSTKWNDDDDDDDESSYENSL